MLSDIRAAPTSARRTVFSFLRLLTTWHCPHLLLRTAVLQLLLSAGQQSIDISCMIAGPIAANPQQPRAASEWDRQTNGRTPYTNNVGLPSTYTVNLIYSLNLLTTARPIPFDHWSALYTEKIHALFPSLFTVFG